jgi:Xaa-Pro aminopeptidase
LRALQIPIALLTLSLLAGAATPPSAFAARRARLQAAFPEAAIIVPGRNFAGQIGETQLKQDPNFWYLTGVESPFAILVMTPQKTALFLPDEFQFASGQYPTLDEGLRRAPWNRPIGRLFPGRAAEEATGIASTYRIDDFAKLLPELVRDCAVVYLPREGRRPYMPPGLAAPTPVADQIAESIAAKLPGKRIENVLPQLAKMRLIKDEFEVRSLRRAAEISGAGMVEALHAIRPGVTDRTIAGVMELAWKRQGSPRASFAPVVNSGPNAMHFFPLLGERYDFDRTMQAGEMVFIDYGAAEFDMYTADVCRTFPVSGKFSPEQRKYYEIVLEAQETAIAAIRPGVMMVDVIRKAAEVFRRHDLEQYEDVGRMGEDKVWGLMPSPTHYLKRNLGIVPYSPVGHGVRDLGHHIGLEVQDSRDYSQPLQPGMVMTIEPKIYIPEKNIAIMIEDMVLVTPAGAEILAPHTPKKVAGIEREMRRR